MTRPRRSFDASLARARATMFGLCHNPRNPYSSRLITRVFASLLLGYQLATSRLAGSPTIASQHGGTQFLVLVFLT
jgi:hypothetical protein